MTVAQPNAAQTHPLAASAQPVFPETDVLEDAIFPSGNLLSDEPPLETELHLRQLILLIQCLEWWWRDPRSERARLALEQAVRIVVGSC